MEVPVSLLLCSSQNPTTPIFVAIRHPLSLQKFTKLITLIFAYYDDSKGMERTICYNSWVVYKVAKTIVEIG